MPSLILPLIAALSVSPSPVDDTFFDSKGVKIRYVSAGEGEAVVLIHGWMSDSRMWGTDGAGNTKLDVSDVPGYQVIAIDCRGHGKSGKPYESGKYGVEMAQDIVRLLDHLKIKRAHLVGYSMGAFISGYIAANHPDRVRSVIYGGQAPLLKGSALATGPSETEIFAKAVEENDLGSYLIAVMPKHLPKPTKAQADIAAQIMFAGKDLKALAAAGLTFDAMAVDEKDLVKSKIPSLFLYGEKESDRLKERVAALQKTLANSEVKVVPGSDHVTAPANPVFGAALVKFIQTHKG